MKILWVVGGYPPHLLAGAELMIHEMSKSLIDAGHDVFVVHHRPESSPQTPYRIDGVNVFPYSPDSLLESIPAADVILTHASPSETFTLARLEHKPVVVVVHNNFVGARSAWLESAPDLTVYNSNWLYEEYARFGKRAESVIVHPPVFSGDYATTPGEHLTLVNLAHSKGSDIFAALAERMPNRKFLAVAGGYGHQRLDYPDNVTIMSQTTNMRDDVYANTKLLLIPSRYESWGRVGIEAAASGIPSVARATKGLRESLGNAAQFVESDALDDWHRGVVIALGYYDDLAERARARAARLDDVYPEQLAQFVDAVERLAA